MAQVGVVQTRVRNVRTLLRYTGLAGRRIVEERIGDEVRVVEWNAGNDFMAAVEDATLLRVLLSEGDFFIVASVAGDGGEAEKSDG
jgi:hypothetical protein